MVSETDDVVVSLRVNVNVNAAENSHVIPPLFVSCPFWKIMKRPTISFNRVLIFSILIRIILIKYSEWHDAHSVVKYTDVDYRVFTDAARFLLDPNEPSPGEFGNKTWNGAAGVLGEWIPAGKYVQSAFKDVSQNNLLDLVHTLVQPIAILLSWRSS